MKHWKTILLLALVQSAAVYSVHAEIKQALEGTEIRKLIAAEFVVKSVQLTEVGAERLTNSDGKVLLHAFLPPTRYGGLFCLREKLWMVVDKKGKSKLTKRDIVQRGRTKTVALLSSNQTDCTLVSSSDYFDIAENVNLTNVQIAITGLRKIPRCAIRMEWCGFQIRATPWGLLDKLTGSDLFTIDAITSDVGLLKDAPTLNVVLRQKVAESHLVALIDINDDGIRSVELLLEGP